MKAYCVFSLILCLSLVSCHRSYTVPHESIFDNKVNPPVDPDYFALELADGSTRYVSPELQLHYKDGGVLVRYDRRDDGHDVYSMIELSTGYSVEFSYAATSVAGPLSDACLCVNGKEIRINSAKAHRINSTGAWIEIIAPGGQNYVFVVTDV